VTTAQRLLLVENRPARYREAGDGPPVLIIPGLGLSSRFYEPVLTEFAAAGFRAIAPDLPGYGQAHGPFTGFSIQGAADWLLRFTDALGVEAAAWVGHSISCQIVLAIAEQVPARVNALALAGPTGHTGRRKLHQAIALARVALTESPRVVLRVARDYARANPVQYVGAWVRAARDCPLERATRVRAPVLLLVGSRDPVPPPSFVAALQARLEQARTEYVRGGNHALPLDRTEEFVALVARFLKSELRE